MPNQVDENLAMAAPPTPPFWFLQRQGKLEPAGTDTYRLAAPNLPEAFISIRPLENGSWMPAFRLKSDGLDLAADAPPAPSPREAWEEAFERYRVTLVV